MYFEKKSVSSDPSYRLKAVINNEIDQINTCIPGTVVGYNVTNGTVTCKPSIQKYAGLESFDTVELENVPVVYSHGGGYSITLPIAPGDPCLILFSQADLDNWAVDGDDLPPNSPRKFELSDAICLPGLFSPRSPLNNLPENGIQLSNPDGEVQMTVSNLGYSLRKGGDELFELLQDMNNDVNEIVTIQAAVNTLIENAFAQGTPQGLQAAAPLINAQNVQIVQKFAKFVERQKKLLNLSNPKNLVRNAATDVI